MKIIPLKILELEVKKMLKKKAEIKKHQICAYCGKYTPKPFLILKDALWRRIFICSKRCLENSSKIEVKKANKRFNFSVAYHHSRKQNIKKAVHLFSKEEWKIKLRETKGKCPNCKKFVGYYYLELDHIYPVSKIEGNKRFYLINDIQPLCKSCNCKKSNFL